MYSLTLSLKSAVFVTNVTGSDFTTPKIWRSQSQSRRPALRQVMAGGRPRRQVARSFEGELLLLQSSEQGASGSAAPHVEIAFATIKGNKAGAEPAAYPRNSAR